MAIQTAASIKQEIEAAEHKMMEIAMFLSRDSVQESQLSIYTLQYKVCEETVCTKKRLLAHVQ